MLDNLITEFLLLIMLGIMIIVNTTLGTFIGTKQSKFDKEKFTKGILKAIVISFCILLFLLTLELVPIILGRVGIEIPTDLITALEVVITTLTAYKKYALDCFNKMKKILGTEEV